MSSPLPDPALRRRQLPAYRALLDEADRWFLQAAETHASDGVQCRAGCTLCCLGLFDISAADAAIVAEGYGSAPLDNRRALSAGARTTVERIRELAPSWGSPYRIDAVGEAEFERISDLLEQLPCAALGADGNCLIYDHRPLICRLHGLPMYDPGRQESVSEGCELNFRPDSLESSPALHFPHAEFTRREERVIERMLGYEPSAESMEGATIVAAALLAAEMEGG